MRDRVRINYWTTSEKAFDDLLHAIIAVDEKLEDAPEQFIFFSHEKKEGEFTHRWTIEASSPILFLFIGRKMKL
jgi:hypothetical protein